MKKENFVNWSGVCNLAIAVAGIIAFWLLSVNGHDHSAAVAFVIAGACAWFALPSLIHWSKS